MASLSLTAQAITIKNYFFLVNNKLKKNIRSNSLFRLNFTGLCRTRTYFRLGLQPNCRSILHHNPYLKLN